MSTRVYARARSVTGALHFREWLRSANQERKHHSWDVEGITDPKVPDKEMSASQVPCCQQRSGQYEQNFFQYRMGLIISVQ